MVGCQDFVTLWVHSIVHGQNQSLDHRDWIALYLSTALFSSSFSWVAVSQAKTFMWHLGTSGMFRTHPFKLCLKTPFSKLETLVEEFSIGFRNKVQRWKWRIIHPIQSSLKTSIWICLYYLSFFRSLVWSHWLLHTWVLQQYLAYNKCSVNIHWMNQRVIRFCC